MRPGTSGVEKQNDPFTLSKSNLSAHQTTMAPTVKNTNTGVTRKHSVHSMSVHTKPTETIESVS